MAYIEIWFQFEIILNVMFYFAMQMQQSVVFQQALVSSSVHILYVQLEKVCDDN